MAVIVEPSVALPAAGDEQDAEQVTLWIEALQTFVEGSNTDEANIDLAGTDGIVGKSTPQTMTGFKSWSNVDAAGGIKEVVQFGINPATGTPSANDGGRIVMYADDVGGGESDIAYIDWVITTATAGSEVGRLDFYVAAGGAPVSQVQILDGSLIPTTDSDVSLGITGTRWGNFFTDAATVGGTLTADALTVDDIALNGKVITMTGSSSDTAVFTVGTNGTLSIVTTDAAAAAANIQITADGTVDIDSAGVLTLDSGAAINIEPASGSAILLDGTISIDAGVVTGATSITSTAFVGDITGAVSGNATTATALATARNIGGVSFDGSGNINLPGVNTAGNQATSGLAATATLAATTTALATARDIGGVSFDGTANINLPGVNTAGNQATSGLAATATVAALATTVTITDNEDTNETNAIIFTAGGDVDGGNLGLESDGHLTYNPSTGVLTATGFTIGAAAIGETELEILDGATLSTAELNILDGVTSTAAELNILDGVTSTAAEINLIDGGTARGTTAVASGDGLLVNDAGTMRMTNVDTVSTYFASHSVGGSNIVTVGTIGTGTWNGTVIASAYLDADTAHLGVAQTVTGAKTFVTGVSRFSRADTTPTGTANTVGDDAVFGSIETTNTGITILGTGQLGIFFGDAASTEIGQIRYQHSTNAMEFRTNGAAAMVIDSSGNLTLVDNSWIGLGSSKGHIEFDDTGIDEINFLNCRVGIGTQAPTSALHIGESPSNNPATPTLSFGDGDTGFYEQIDDVLWFSSAGTPRWKSDAGYLLSTITAGKATILNSVASATVPNFVWYDDQDTGLGHAGANILSLIAGGTNGLNVISSGNVGIGTASPAAPVSGGSPVLHIRGAAPVVRWEDTTTSNLDWEVCANGGDLNFYAESVGTPFMILQNNSSGNGILDLVTTGNRIDFNTENTTSIRAAATGTLDFEILTVDTVQILATGLNISAANARGNLTSTTGTNPAYWTISNTGSTTYMGAENSAASEFGTGSIAYASIFGAGGADATQFITDNVVRMTILPTSGNVGIGTASPDGPLHVLSSGTANLTHSSFVQGIFQNSNAGGAESSIAIISNATGSSRIEFGDEADVDAGRIIYSNNTNSFQFITDAANALHIDSSGGVYIGETSNANMTTGLTVMVTGSTQGFCLKHPSVDHGLTSGGSGTSTEIDDFFTIQCPTGSDGGVQIKALMEDTNQPKVLEFLVYGGTANAQKTAASGIGLVNFEICEHDGSNALANVTSNGNLFSLRTGTTLATRFLVDEDGDMWSATTGQTFDDYDDTALLDSYDAIRSDYREWTEQEEDVLVKAGILGAPLSEGGLTCVTQLQRALVGNARQMASRMSLQQEQIESLKKELRLLKG